MADEQTALPLIRTKLYRPQVMQDHLQREHLLDRLERNRQRPLTLVSAPAGYGKTTLLSCWLGSCDIPSAWVSLDNNDNDPRVFLSYFLAAVQTQFPGMCQNTEALLNSSELPPMSIITHHLINELDQIDNLFILVLDDYHVISNQNLHALITKLLQHPPGPMHLVLSTRVDPMLPLVRFRARGQMTEIRVSDLRFSQEETGAFLNLLVGVPVDSNTADTLGKKTEGWVTGLRLSALFLRQRSDLNRIIGNLPTDSQHIMEYLLTEVLSTQSGEIQEYLLTTSILDRFCAPLCDAVCVPGDRSLECKMGGQQLFEWLETSDLFVVPLDEQKRWFRYHHIFQKLLQQQLKHRFETDEITVLHRRASLWFDENNLIDEALQHALVAGDVTTAAQLIEKNRHIPLNEDRWFVLEKWLKQLPDEIVQERPELLLARVWILNHKFAMWAIPPLLTKVEKLFGEESGEVPRGEIDFFKGIFLYWEGQGARATELIGQALDKIPKKNIGVRNEAEIYFAISLQLAGQGKQAEQVYRRKLYNESSEGTRKMRLLGSLIFIHLLSGDLLEAEQATRQMANMAKKANNVHIRTWASYLQGIIHYVWNNLETAGHHFSLAIENNFTLDAFANIDSYAGLILSFQAMRQYDRANETMNQMINFAQESGNPDYLFRARSVQSRLWLLQGDLESSVSWLKTADLSFDKGTLLFWLEVPRITQCRVLIAQGSKVSLDEAKPKLEKHRRFFQATHNTPQLIEILILQSMACHEQGQTEEALAKLEQAVTLAHPGEYIQPFLNLGSRMADLLGRLLKKDQAVGYIRQILAAFDGYESLQDQEASFPLSEQQPWMRNQALDQPLTNRELETLSLLAQGLQNKEIAAKLFLSPETVKSHASNIYRKIDAHNRQQAVAKAYRLGVLTRNQ